LNKQIGIINKNIINILNLNETEEKPIFIGDSNLNYIKTKHPDDFNKYENNIIDIISNPTYLDRNEKKNSIEFIKEYKVDNDFVLVAVRVSGSGNYFARTMYIKLKNTLSIIILLNLKKNKKYVIMKLT